MSQSAIDPGGNPSLRRYLHDLGRCRPLDADEEQRLARAYARTHAPALEARLVESCLRLVVAVASRLCVRKEMLLDLIQEGNLGLIDGVRHFDPARGLRLGTYATHWIRARIFTALIANWRLVKTGTSTGQRAMFFRLRRERARLERLGRGGDTAALAQRFGLDIHDFERLAHHLEHAEASLDAPLRDGLGEVLGDLIADAYEARPDVRAEEAETRARVRHEIERCLQSAKSRDRLILEGRWCSDDPPTLDLLGKQLGVSRERIRQIVEHHRARLAAALAERPAEAPRKPQ
jgi:RNA polymerase sigma-32 factor